MSVNRQSLQMMGRKPIQQNQPASYAHTANQIPIL